jgi:hypothetical protein
VIGADQACADVALRLIGGELPAQDPELAAHVGSCLRCFRTASEMRDLPQIATLLREERPTDPPDAFWAGFPAVVGRAWAARNQRLSRWQRAIRWLGSVRLPIPAAMATGVAAGVLIVALLGRIRAPAPPTVVAAEATRPADEDAVEGAPDPVPPLLGDEDPWALLELVDLKSAVAQAGYDSGAAAADDGGDFAPTPAEEVEQLDGDDLPAVALALQGPSRI